MNDTPRPIAFTTKTAIRKLQDGKRVTAELRPRPLLGVYDQPLYLEPEPESEEEGRIQPAELGDVLALGKEAR